MSRRLDIPLIYAAGLVQGLALVTFPAAGVILTSPSFHNLSSSEYGSLFLPMVVAAILASSLSGPVARRRSLKAVLLTGLSFDLLAMTGLAASQLAIGNPAVAYASLFIAMTALGLGFGATLTALNALAAAYFPERSDRALTALHALLGTGTALAPLLVALVTGLGIWWSLPLAVAALLAALVLAGTRLSATASVRAQDTGTGRDITLAGATRLLGLFVAAGIVYGIVETIFANWALIYLREDAGVSVRDAGYALTAFWAMVTIGRLAVAALGARLSPTRVYILLPCLMIIAFLWIATVGNAAAGIGAFALAGLACSAFLPMTIGFAQARYRDLSEIVSGIMIAAYMLGFGIGSFGLGPLREAAGIPLSILYGASAALAALLAGIAIALGRRRNATSTPS